jgi:hypothetical protein
MYLSTYLLFFYLTPYLPTYLLTYLPTLRPMYLLNYLPTHLTTFSTTTYLHTHLPSSCLLPTYLQTHTFLPTYPPAYIHTYMHTCIHTYTYIPCGMPVTFALSFFHALLLSLLSHSHQVHAAFWPRRWRWWPGRQPLGECVYFSVSVFLSLSPLFSHFSISLTQSLFLSFVSCGFAFSSQLFFQSAFVLFSLTFLKLHSCIYSLINCSSLDLKMYRYT